METKFLIIGILNGKPFQKEFLSPASLGQRLGMMLERGQVGDKLTIEVVRDVAPVPSEPFTGTLGNPYFPEE